MATGSEGYNKINEARRRGATSASRRRPLRATTDRAAQQQVVF